MAKAKKSRSRSLYPTSAAGRIEEQESVAKSLIEKLGLYEGFPASNAEGSDGKGDVESE